MPCTSSTVVRACDGGWPPPPRRERPADGYAASTVSTTTAGSTGSTSETAAGDPGPVTSNRNWLRRRASRECARRHASTSAGSPTPSARSAIAWIWRTTSTIAIGGCCGSRITVATSVRSRRVVAVTVGLVVRGSRRAIAHVDRGLLGRGDLGFQHVEHGLFVRLVLVRRHHGGDQLRLGVRIALVDELSLELVALGRREGILPFVHP